MKGCNCDKNKENRMMMKNRMVMRNKRGGTMMKNEKNRMVNNKKRKK